MAFLERTPAERLRAAVPALAIHALIGFAFLRGLAISPPETVPEELKLIQLSPEAMPPPPLTPPPEPAKGKSRAAKPADPRPEGAASPPNLVSRATPVVAPEPLLRLPLPPPLTAATEAGTGSQATTGAAPVPGPGTGSGGIGDGTGSGGAGSGAGGGGGGGDGDGWGETPPRRIRGRLRLDDLPAELEEAGQGGVVGVLYAVETDGRVTDCKVTQSSGSALLDRTTCRLIEQRYRYRPSLDRDGRPVRSFVEHKEEWVVELLPPDPEEQRPRRRRWF